MGSWSSSSTAFRRKLVSLDGSIELLRAGVGLAGVVTWTEKLTTSYAWTGFDIKDLATGYMKGPRAWTFMYEGVVNSETRVRDQ